MKGWYRIHKWLAAVAAAAALTWFVSGALLIVPGRWLTLSPEIVAAPDAEAAPRGSPDFDGATISLSAAIESARRQLKMPIRITGVRLRQLPGQLVYELSTEHHGIHLVDVAQGMIVTVNEELAKQIVERVVGKEVSRASIAWQTDPAPAYAGPLPAYRIPLGDTKGTVFYVAVSTGQAHISDRLTRIVVPVLELHRLRFLYAMFPAAVARAVMLALALVGVGVSASGIVILFALSRRWLQRHRLKEA
jgi:hypothetical protein